MDHQNFCSISDLVESLWLFHLGICSSNTHYEQQPFFNAGTTESWQCKEIILWLVRLVKFAIPWLCSAAQTFTPKQPKFPLLFIITHIVGQHPQLWLNPMQPTPQYKLGREQPQNIIIQSLLYPLCLQALYTLLIFSESVRTNFRLLNWIAIDQSFKSYWRYSGKLESRLT